MCGIPYLKYATVLLGGRCGQFNGRLPWCQGRVPMRMRRRRRLIVPQIGYSRGVAGNLMTISRRIFVGLIGAAALTGRARAANKIVGGTLGGQAPLWPFYVAAKKGIFAAEDIDVE